MEKTKQNKINKEASDNNEYQKIDDGTFYRFENIGDSIEGRLLTKGQSERYAVGLYDIETENGVIRILGKTQLDRLLNQIIEGEFIKIEYVDNQTTPKGDMMLFNVYRKK